MFDRLLASKEDFENSKNEPKKEMAMTETRLENKITRATSELENKITETKSELENKITRATSELENKITESKSELKQEMVMTEARLENKITESKSELKQDIAEIKGSVNLLTKLFFGSVFLILVDIAITLLHHT